MTTTLSIIEESICEYFDFGRIKITKPNKTVLWTNSFKIVRLEINNQTTLDL